VKRGTGDTRGDARAVWPQRTGRRAFLKGAGLAGAASLAGAVLPDSDARAAIPRRRTISASKNWAKAILGALPDVANLSCIEIKNEVKFASLETYSSGFDSGWPAGAVKNTTVGKAAIAWAKQMIPYIRSIAPGVPVTASTTTDNRYFPKDPTADLAAFVAAAGRTADRATSRSHRPWTQATPTADTSRSGCTTQAVRTPATTRRLFRPDLYLRLLPEGFRVLRHPQTPGGLVRRQRAPFRHHRELAHDAGPLVRPVLAAEHRAFGSAICPAVHPHARQRREHLGDRRVLGLKESPFSSAG
jgi:hypothetical protein